MTTILAHRAIPSKAGLVDLTFQFTALEDGVTLARRGTNKYGGLNIRLSPVKELRLIHHADPPNALPRRAWSDSIGVRSGGTKLVGLAVFESSMNPDYPGDYVQYAESALVSTDVSQGRFALRIEARKAAYSPLPLMDSRW